MRIILRFGKFWEDGGFAYRHIFSIGALAADVALAIVVSAAAGWAVQRWRVGRPASG